MIKYRNFNKRWFWKTLFGYTVTVVTLDRQYTVRHRPFRRPDFIAGNPKQGLRGRQYNAVLFDEIAYMTPADKRKLEALSKGLE